MRLVYLIILAACGLLYAGFDRHSSAAEIYDEVYRPQFHFSAKQGWLNDPNGLVYFDGTYHLFYQHNPFGTNWGNMSWGHATSPDLLHWTERSPAIVGDPTGVKFSGTAVVDYANTAGLQTGATPTMALFYTSVGSFDQRMAYSTDGGSTFRYYDDNPVLPSVSHADDRDPQVFWHEGSQKWVQALWVAAHDGKPQSINFFGSTDLKSWSYLSEMPHYFECPDFFELPVDGDPNNTRWVLYGASGDYQVGSFDGTSFVPDAPAAGKVTQDFGANFYAAQSWHNVPADDGRRIQVAWMQGAAYPDMPFNQQMSFPAELTLHSTSDGIRMFREPVAEISSLYGAELALSDVALSPGGDPLGDLAGELFHIKTQIELGTASTVGFTIRGADVRYDVATQTLTALGRSAPLAPVNGMIDLELLVDRSSLEVFGGGGRASITNGFTPPAGNQDIDLYSQGGAARIVSLSAYDLRSAWPSEPPTPQTGLIGRWQFDDPTNMAGFADSGGQEFTLANSGIVSGVSGVAGTAVDFNNGGDYAFVPDNAAMDGNRFSVSLWLNPDSVGEASHIVGKSHYSLPGAWGIEQLSDGRLKFFVQTESGQVAEIHSSQALDLDAWHHAVASYDADLGRLELFIDGALSAASENDVTGAIGFDLAPLMVGRRAVGGETLNAMNGQLDELQLYGSPLSPGEIDFLHNHPGLAIDAATYPVGGLKLQVDVDTGSVAVVNSTGAAESIKGYSILSNAAGLNVAGWHSLADRSAPAFDGWEEANPSPGALSEINLAGDYAIGPSARLILGKPTGVFPTPAFGTAVRNTEYAFDYIASDGSVYHGDVEFTGVRATNNLLLTVDPSTGQVLVENSSAYTVKLLGYSVTSDSQSLLPGDGQWNSLADQGVAGAEEANPSTGVLSELIALVGNGLVLAPGETFSLGAAYNVAGLPDLSFEFFMTSEPLAGDFNADGTVDGADLAVWSAGYGDAYSGNDLLVWQRNLGETNPAGIPKILRGVVRYESIVATAATIPEPGSVAMALIFVLARAASSTWPKTRRRPEVVC